MDFESVNKRFIIYQYSCLLNSLVGVFLLIITTPTYSVSPMCPPSPVLPPSPSLSLPTSPTHSLSLPHIVSIMLLLKATNFLIIIIPSVQMTILSRH